VKFGLLFIADLRGGVLNLGLPILKKMYYNGKQDMMFDHESRKHVNGESGCDPHLIL
jgi:hypothetical protein